MNFANLFTRLPAVSEDMKNPDQPNWTHRNGSGNGSRGRKRKTGGEQTGSYQKKHCYQGQGNTPYDTFKGDTTKTVRYHMQSTEGERALAGNTNEVINNHNNKAAHKSKCFKGQNHKTKKNFNGNNHHQQQQQERKIKGQNNQRQWNDRGRRPGGDGGPMLSKGGRGGKYGNAKRSVQGKPTRFMTEEFKDQNALLVDGRLLCRHFLWGRCIKEGDCQLEHIQSYNNLIKEICKFYVQGFCTKGESCPYMHKSFPCKFFHRRGKCSQGEGCRFSHEPLNDVTEKLLDEALKRENYLIEIAKKAEQEACGQPENADESEAVEADSTPDILIQPLRTNFYNSAETNAEKETLSLEAEEPSDNTDEAAGPDASDTAQPHSPASANCNLKETVCYSVEAVLGPQLFRPFPSLFTPPGSQESTSLSVPQTVSEATSGSANQSEAPYSVDAVLRSFKSVESSTFGHRPAPLAVKTVSYSPRTHPDPVQSSEHQHETFLPNTRDEINKCQEKKFNSLSALRAHTGLISKVCPDQSKRCRDMSVPLKTVQKPSHELSYSADASSRNTEDMKQSMHLPTDLTPSVNCRNQTRAPKQPSQLNSCFPSQTFESQSSIKSSSAPLGPTKSKCRAVVPVEHVAASIKTRGCANSAVHHSEAKELAELSKNAQSDPKVGTRQHHSAKITQESSKHEFSVARKKIQKIPFKSLFASPINDSLTPTTGSVTVPACPQGFIPQSATCTREDKHVKAAAELDKTSASSFHSLFATPPIASLPRLQSQTDYSRTPPSGQQSINNAFHSSDSEQRASNIESPLLCRARANITRASPKFSPSPENKTVTQPTEQLVNPVSSLVSDFLSETSTSPDSSCPNSSTAQTTPRLPDTSSLSGSTANSVLKTLFLCLSPYQEDGEQQADSIQISVPSESEKIAESRTELGKKGKNKKKNRRKKKHEAQGSHKVSTERAAAQSS